MYKAILRNRSLQILGIAESVSNIGNWITMLAVFSLIVFRGGGDVAQSSAVFLTGLLPTLLVSPLAGWLCDRFDRKWLMVGSELLSGLITSGLIFVDRLELIYGLLALQAVSMSIIAPARQASVPHLVARGDLTRANAFLQQLAGLIKIGAPMLAGALLAVMNPHIAIILDVISFALSAAILTRLPSLPPSGRTTCYPAEDNRPLETPPLRTPISVLRTSWPLRFLFVLTFLAITVIIGFDVLSSVFVRDVLRGEAGLYGVLIGLIGLGTVAGMAVLMAGKGQPNHWRDVLFGLGLLAMIPASLALATRLEQVGLARLLVGACCLLGGVGNGLINVQAGTLLQLLSPSELLGRMGGLFQSTMVAGQLIGLLAVPVLVPSLLSMAAYFMLATGMLSILTLYAALSLRRLGLRSSPGQAGADANASQTA
jgi:DHA3 family macrolide efflux protein-like MFS transporter